mgnify:FL=1
MKIDAKGNVKQFSKLKGHQFWQMPVLVFFNIGKYMINIITL